MVQGRGRRGGEFLRLLLPDSRILHVQKNVTDSPSGKEGSVLIVEFQLAGQRFQALNGGTHFDYSLAASLSVDCADQAEVDRLWGKLSEGGTVLECSWLRDRYGVPWQIVPSVLPKMLADPDQAKAKRVMEAMMKMVKIDIATLQRAYDGR